jgi:3-oxoacyl-[acyl-carrier-protein] synthase-3
MSEDCIHIIGTGSYVPPDILTNTDIELMRPEGVLAENWTNDKWIFSRTGIHERRIAPKEWASSDLMVKAAKQALCSAKMEIDAIDLIVASTSFPDMGFNAPRTTEVLKHKLGARKSTLSVAEDAACAGFPWALERARMEMCMHHEFQRALVVSGDKVSSAVNYADRGTCILFGDASGAVILERNDTAGGVIHSIRETDTNYLEGIKVPAGGSALPMTHELLNAGAQFMTMPGGKDMLRIIGGDVIPRFYDKMDSLLTIGSIKYIIPHQANVRIIDAAAKRINAPDSIVFKDNIECFGNTSGSSIPLALDTLCRQGKLNSGDIILLIGFGAGFIYGANLIVWTKKHSLDEERNSQQFMVDYSDLETPEYGLRMRGY